MNDLNMKKPIENYETASIGFSDSVKPIFSGKPVNRAESEKFIVFSINRCLYAVSSKKVAEVTLPLAVASLPSAPEWLFGIANLRGEIITVLDLPKILGAKSVNLTGKTKFIILQAKDGAASFAFAVDKVSEILALSNGQIEACREEAAAPYVFGKTAHPNGVLHLLDVEKMLASLNL